MTSDRKTSSVQPVAEVMEAELEAGPGRRTVAARSHRARKLNAKGETRLHVAARLNKVRDVVALLMEGADINARDYAGLHSSSPSLSVTRSLNYSCQINALMN